MTDKERTLLHGLMDLAVDTRKQVTGKIFEKTLNDMVSADRECVAKLVESRVPCNSCMEAETLAVPYAETPDGPLSLGLIGVLNAIMGLHGLLLVAHYSDKEGKHFTHFSVKLKGQEKKDGNADQQSGHGPELRETG